MNKSKFKTVKFKPLSADMSYSMETGWWAVGQFRYNFICSERYILDNPELFEVEKAEREFEEGAWYKLHSHKYKHGYTLGYYYELLNCFYIVGTNVPHYPKDFDKIGEKIEL